MDISIRQACKIDGVVSAAAYVSMHWQCIEKEDEISETAYITYAYSRENGKLDFKHYSPSDVSFETYTKMTEWSNETRIQQALVSMTDYVINNNLET